MLTNEEIMHFVHPSSWKERPMSIVQMKINKAKIDKKEIETLKERKKLLSMLFPMFLDSKEYAAWLELKENGGNTSDDYEDLQMIEENHNEEKMIEELKNDSFADERVERLETVLES